MNSKYFVILAIVLFFAISTHNAYAVNSIDWTYNGYVFRLGPFISFENHYGSIVNDFPISVIVNATDESNFTTNGFFDTIDVLVTSTVEPNGTLYTLNETAPNSGIFKGQNFVLLNGNYRFHTTDVVDLVYGIEPTSSCSTDDTITQLDARHGGPDNGITVYSETDNQRWLGTHWGGGVRLVLTETGENTCEFAGQLKFTTTGTSDDATGTLLVSEGDILGFRDSVEYDFYYNAQIIPTVPGKGSIIVNHDTPNDWLTSELTATYHGLSAEMDIEYDGTAYGEGYDPGVGTGGGGAVRPGLVLNVIASLFGGGNAKLAPPTLGLDQFQKRIVEDGFSFNDNAVDVEQYYTPYPLIITEVGKLNTIKLKIYENRGIDNIAHVGLSYGLGKGEIFNEGKATIEYDRTFDGIEHITLFDPKHVLESVNVTTAKTSCSANNDATCLEVKFDHIFRAPLEFNMVATNIWDFQRNSWQNYFNHGIHITGESMNPPEQYTGIYKGHIYHLTETGKNIAVDEEGNVWEFDKTWNRSYKKQIAIDNDVLNPEKILALEKLGFEYSDAQQIFGFDRVDHRFEDIIHSQQIQAQDIMKNLCSECQDKPFDGIDKTFSYDMPPRNSKLDNSKILIDRESNKAEEFLKQYFAKLYPAKIFD